MKVVFAFTLLLSFQNIFASNSCRLRETCDECIKDSNKCVWCALNDYADNTVHRCRSETENLESWCVGNIKNPKTNGTINEDVDFSSDIGKIVQLKPQIIKIDMRPGDSYDFKFSIKPAQDYPVDLYFLLDVSKTMTNITRQIVDQTENIYRTMQNMTKNIFIGTGSFIDKNILPFVRNVTSKSAYSFRNKLKLTNQYKVFQKILSETEFGISHDEQEGTLDALSQVLTCPNEIGWRNESTKLVFVFTDAPYHAAGDGKLAGIYRPYDGKCHTINGTYTKEVEMDYPSVSIINKLAADEEIIVIFVVADKAKTYYDELVKKIGGAKTVAYENDDNMVLVDILKSTYKKITQTIKLKVHTNSTVRQYFDYSFDPDCFTDAAKRNRKCKIKAGTEKTFRGRIKLLKYFDSKRVDVNILFEGIKEKLTLKINIISKCDCDIERNSKHCSSAGALICGVCDCNPERYGKNCICEKNSNTTQAKDDSNCNSTLTSSLCSGQGSCVCGNCICQNKFSGKHCECHPSNCKQQNNRVCSGNGDCYCGTCNCNAGFTGEACDCSTDINNCILDSKICNDRGTCLCGSCQCTKQSRWDARKEGNFCTLSCPDEKSCHNRQCQLLESVVLCYLKQKQCQLDSNSDVNIKEIDNEDRTIYNSTDDWKNCPNLRTDVGCYTTFLYHYDTDSYGIEIKVQPHSNCVESYYLYGGVCLGVLIFIGMATLVTWKYVTDKRDRLEYERFVKEAQALNDPCVNSIYVPAIATFHNPGFRKRSIHIK